MNSHQKLPKFLFLLLVGIILSITLSIASKLVANKIKFHEDPDLMKEEILSYISIGSPIADAKEVMEQNGFTCEYMENETHGTTEENLRFNVDFLYCDFSKPLLSKALVVSRRWQVVIEHQDESVESVFVSTGLVGL